VLHFYIVMLSVIMLSVVMQNVVVAKKVKKVGDLSHPAYLNLIKEAMNYVFHLALDNLVN